ncbi:MAG TPA: BamA/TamA family outer membrane protein [Vicinamibacterales bacterium]|nr:BamA/TamA family outer membrane protein [Vicinamibacterales bacterium]HPW21914.1 BamA/TamA family outer membrane protein [Vicinamibacterales bacterium]
MTLSGRRLSAAVCAAAALLAAAGQASAGRYHPRLKFQVLRTPHFTIYYHQGEAELARRLAAIAEDVRRDLPSRTALEPPPHVHVVLVDQSDVANGWSTPVPYDLIEVAAAPAAPSSFLGHQDDWLRTVFTHEFAHILHLDRVGGAMKALRRALGRHPATFPNLFLPEWQIEGFATWAEGAASGFGRPRAADVAAVIEASSGARGLPIDRAGGGLVAWPSGHTPYFFGGRFYQDLAGRTSEAALGDFTRQTARRLPYFGGGAFRRVFGESERNAWRRALADAHAESGRATLEPAALRRLTRDGFAVGGPRVIRAGKESTGEEPAVYYSTQGPHRFPEIRQVRLAGGRSAPVTPRYGGDTLSSDGRWVFFDQLEYDASVALVSDLYALELASGRVCRLSRGRRLTDPDVDGRATRLVAIEAASGRRRPVILALERDTAGRPALAAVPASTMGTAGCDYASPRWSPDSTRIAATRQCPGALPAIVVFGADGSGEVAIVQPAGARDITPAWLADGRTLIFASDRQDRRFKLFAVSDPGQAQESGHGEPILLVDAPGGVLWPDPAPDGRTVVFTSMTADGYDVFASALPESPPRPAQTAGPVAGREGPAGPVRIPAAAAGVRAGTEDREEPATAVPYSPWRTLVPRAWWPIGAVSGDRLDLGGSVGASDALGYHEYRLSASWRASSDRADLAFEGAALEWSAWYAYNRWTPSFFVSAKDSVDIVRLATPAPGGPLTSDERTREVFAGVLVPWRRARTAQRWLAGVDLETRRLPGSAGIADRSRRAARAAWAFSSAHAFGYSISPERGVRAGATLERVSPALGADGQATSVTADARAYVPAFGRHDVLAVRAAVGSSRGDRLLRRQYRLGETALAGPGSSFGSDAVGLLRGLAKRPAAGHAIAVANLDYRFPVARVERGVRTWPVFLRDLHGAVFVDAGATGADLGSLGRPAWSAGAEFSSRLTLGYSWLFNLTAGVAWVHDPARADPKGRAAAFVRTGYAF